jgi:hypothetical protein
MMRVLLAVCFAASTALFAASADAQPRPSSGKCEAMSAAYGPAKLWWGRFSGGRKARMSFYSDRGVEYHTAELCFTDRRACEAWLYRLKSDWQFMPRWNECRRGYRG